MIIFNNLGHCFKVSADDSPIVWVDAQDATSYTLSGSDVLTLDNKGSLGGAMTLVGSVKFANNGFESLSTSDYITRDLGEPFLNTNSFTIATTFDLKNVSPRNWFSGFGTDTNNRIEFLKDTNNTMSNYVNSSGSNVTLNPAYNIGIQTIISSYDLSSNSITLLVYNQNQTFNSITFNSVADADIFLLRGWFFNASSGANNPLHEFRLYDRAFDLTEMQNLQTELNNKYTP